MAITEDNVQPTQPEAKPEARSFTPVGFKDALRNQSSGLVAQGGAANTL